MVDDPKDYRWCGYTEAVAGSRRAQGAIRRLLADQFGKELNWREAGDLYRCWLFEGGQRREDLHGRTVRKGVSRERAAEVLDRGGRLTRATVLRCRVRYFTDGAVIGSRAFVDGVFEANRLRFGANRKTGARPMRFGEWAGLCAMRDLQVDVIRAPG